MNPRRWLVLVAMTGSLSMIMLDQTVVSVALPSMARELPLTPHGQQWVVNAYVLALAALVALGGRAADLLGRVRAFQIGVTLFFLASAGCAVAWDTTSIIGFRALQGAGAALMVPVSATIVLAVFPEGERGRVMAIYAGISQVFLALGPLVGGLLTEYVTWRAVFLLNVPVGLATLALVAVAKIENRPVAGARIAVRDAALVVPGLALVTLGVQQLASWGPISLVLLAAGVGLVAWFVARQLRSADPLIHLRLFADRGFTGAAVAVSRGSASCSTARSTSGAARLRAHGRRAGRAPLILPLSPPSRRPGFARASGPRCSRAGAVTAIVAWPVACPRGRMVDMTLPALSEESFHRVLRVVAPRATICPAQEERVDSTLPGGCLTTAGRSRDDRGLQSPQRFLGVFQPCPRTLVRRRRRATR